MRRSALIAVLALVLGAMGVAGCGGGEETSPTAETVEGTLPTGSTAESPGSAGEDVWAANGCGSCHTLEAAGSNGNIGPNLDESQPDMELAVERVTNGAGTMPAFKGQLSEKQIADVATYVVESTSG